MKNQTIDKQSIFLKKFILAAFLVIEKKNFNIVPETKEIIDADLVPELSNELLHQYELNKKLIQKIHEVENINSEQPQQTISPTIQILQPTTRTRRRTTQSPQPPTQNDGTNGFEKIQALLADYSISRIQCLAPNKPLTIIRTGQKQTTKINLTQKQISEVFQGIADQAHLPLIEGPFKVSLKEYTINGINSTVANARFIIQKQTAYSFLERQNTR